LSPFYALERLSVWLVIGLGLLLLFSFSKKKFQQVILVAVLSLVSGVVIRLFSLQSTDKTDLRNEAFFLIGIGALYGIIWLGSRYLGKSASHEPRAKR